MDNQKLQTIFEEFYKEVEFPSYRPAFDDERLWQLFNSKVREIQVEMLETGEIYQSRAGLRVSKLPQTLRVTPTVPTPVSTLPATRVPPSVSTPVSTPPTTPKLPIHQHLDGLKLWQSMDSSVQTRLFHDLLRTAKEPQSLIYEWDKYCTEVHRKEHTTDAIQERLSDEVAGRGVSGPRSLSSEIRTPVETPPPKSPKMIDLKTMIETRLHEASLKRKRAKEEAEKSKRVKVGPQ
jgi:hypothetical protein